MFLDGSLEFVGASDIRHIASPQSQQELNAALAEIHAALKRGVIPFYPRWH